jgi:hypothetical protein
MAIGLTSAVSAVFLWFNNSIESYKTRTFLLKPDEFSSVVVNTQRDACVQMLLIFFGGDFWKFNSKLNLESFTLILVAILPGFKFYVII